MPTQTTPAMPPERTPQEKSIHSEIASEALRYLSKNPDDNPEFFETVREISGGEDPYRLVRESVIYAATQTIKHEVEGISARLSSDTSD